MMLALQSAAFKYATVRRVPVPLPRMEQELISALNWALLRNREEIDNLCRRVFGRGGKKGM